MQGRLRTAPPSPITSHLSADHACAPGGADLSRERWLILYCLSVGVLGWAWLLSSGLREPPWALLLLFLALALMVESAGFRVPPSDPHSLVGIVLLTAALSLGVPTGALIAAISGLIFGILQPLLYGRTRH